MVRALLEPRADRDEVGQFSSDDDKVDWTTLFANLVTVTFSAFDPYDPHPDRDNTDEALGYAYVGLKQTGNSSSVPRTPKSPEMLREEFVASVGRCVVGARANRWRQALQTLETDPLFKDAEVARLADRYEESRADEEQDRIDDESLRTEAAGLFSRMSTGHKIVLHTITRLVEKVEEKTLVLLDEPESHLHPPLLSAFVRALSDLLIDRNGVAIIATHTSLTQSPYRSACWSARSPGGRTAHGSGGMGTADASTSSVMSRVSNHSRINSAVPSPRIRFRTASGSGHSAHLNFFTRTQSAASSRSRTGTSATFQ